LDDINVDLGYGSDVEISLYTYTIEGGVVNNDTESSNLAAGSRHNENDSLWDVFTNSIKGHGTSPTKERRRHDPIPEQNMKDLIREFRLSHAFVKWTN
jgi:hypothetical protein